VMELESPVAQFFPYSYLVYTIIPKHATMLTSIQLGSAAYMVGFLFLAFLDFRRKRG